MFSSNKNSLLSPICNLAVELQGGGQMFKNNRFILISIGHILVSRYQCFFGRAGLWVLSTDGAYGQLIACK